MSDKPKRRFWQIHLSTAILLMFAAGGMGWLNSRMRFREFPPSTPSRLGGCLERGWPIVFYRVDAILVTDRRGTLDEVRSRYAEVDAKDWLYVEGRGVAITENLLYLERIGEPVALTAMPSMPLLNGFLDIAVGLTVLVLIAFVCEWLIRRREGRKT